MVEIPRQTKAGQLLVAISACLVILFELKGGFIAEFGWFCAESAPNLSVFARNPRRIYPFLCGNWSDLSVFFVEFVPDFVFWVFVFFVRLVVIFVRFGHFWCV